jgi:hypothetical protein
VDFTDVPVGTEHHLIPVCRAGVCNQHEGGAAGGPDCNPLAPTSQPFTHRGRLPGEPHFDDYLGDCATTIGACGQNDDDQVIANDYMNFLTANGLPPYSKVELVIHHPDTVQDIPMNDAVTKQVVDFNVNNAA